MALGIVLAAPVVGMEPMLMFWLLAASQIIIFSIYSVSVACDEGGDKKIRLVRNCIILAITLTATYFVPWDLIN